MDDTPVDPDQARTLRFLRILVTVLTGVMIAGLIVLIVLFVTRFPGRTALPLPDAIALPDGSRALAFTQGKDWYAVVTEDDLILVFDRSDGRLRQTIRIAP